MLSKKIEILSFWVFLWIAYCFGATPSKKSTPSNLLPLPGTDFVGFGYDIRFAEADDALTLPILSWTYDNGQTYAYPLNPANVFKVPDEVYVRTLSFTRASSTAFETSQDYKTHKALSVGLDTTTSIQGDGTIAPPKSVSCPNIPPATNLTTNGADPCQVRNRAPNINSALLNMNAQNITYINGLTTQSKSRVFSLGTKTSFVTDATNSLSNYVIELTQENQLYQIIVDKRQAAQGLATAINTIMKAGPYSANQQLYIDFLEKWGTHYVISAVVGGSISMLASVDKIGQTSDVSTISNLSLALNTTVTTNNTSSQNISNYVANAPQCAKIGKKGWILDQLTTQTTGQTTCIEPVYVSCNVLIEAEQWLYNSNNPSPYIKGTDTNLYPSEILITWWSCFFWGACWEWSFWIVIEIATWPQMNFNQVSGNPTQNTMQLLSKGYQSFNYIINKGYYKNYVTENTGTTSFRPSLINFNINIVTSNPSGGQLVVKFIDTGANFTDTRDDKTCFTFSVFNQQIGLSTSNIQTPSTFVGSSIGPLDQWNEIDLIVDWASASVDLWYQNIGSPGTNYKQLAVSGIPFIEKCTRIQRIIYWNEENTADSTVGNVNFCNPSTGSHFKTVPTMTAIASVSSVFTQSVTTNVDYAYASTFSNASLTQTTTWTVRGGDTSTLDLLNPNKGSQAIDTWKASVFTNPVAISYNLKPISTLFPVPLNPGDTDFRVEMDYAVSQFMLTQEVISSPGVGPQNCDYNGNCNSTVLSAGTYVDPNPNAIPTIPSV